MERYLEIYDRILKAVTTPHENGDTAIIANVELAPTGGFDGNKIFPPTYSAPENDKDKSPRIHIESRNFDGKSEQIVVIDSVQSAANRQEIAIAQAKEAKVINIPDIETYCKTLDKTISTLEMPHRIFDHAIRDGTITEDGQEFCNTEVGQKLLSINPRIVMKTILQYSPMSLIYGVWGSTYGIGARSFKLPRSVVNEIIGGLISQTFRSSSRLDPLGIENTAEIYAKTKQLGVPWQLEPFKENGPEKSKANSKKNKDEIKIVKASEINLGSIPPTIAHGGVSVSWIKDRFQLQLRGLCRYNTGNPAEDAKARAMLASLALLAFDMKSQDYTLRSGCDLKRLKEKNTFQFERYDSFEAFSLEKKELISMYNHAANQVKDYDPKKTLKLVATPKVETMVRQTMPINRIS